MLMSRCDEGNTLKLLVGMQIAAVTRKQYRGLGKNQT